MPGILNCGAASGCARPCGRNGGEVALPCFSASRSSLYPCPAIPADFKGSSLMVCPSDFAASHATFPTDCSQVGGSALPPNSAIEPGTPEMIGALVPGRTSPVSPLNVVTGPATGMSGPPVCNPIPVSPVVRVPKPPPGSSVVPNPPRPGIPRLLSVDVSDGTTDPVFAPAMPAAPGITVPIVCVIDGTVDASPASASSTPLIGYFPFPAPTEGTGCGPGEFHPDPVVVPSRLRRYAGCAPAVGDCGAPIA